MEIDKPIRCAVMGQHPKTFEIREYPIPAIGDDEILIKVEACGVCGTDGHEYNRDPFGLCPVVLGHEGTGEIVAMGRNITKDTAGPWPWGTRSSPASSPAAPVTPA